MPYLTRIPPKGGGKKVKAQLLAESVEKYPTANAVEDLHLAAIHEPEMQEKSFFFKKAAA